MLTRIDHVMICVSDLQQGIDTYTRLGFNISPGGVHPGQGTRSMEAAALWMADHGVAPPARGIRNTGEQAMLVRPDDACGAYIGFVGPA